MNIVYIIHKSEYFDALNKIYHHYEKKPNNTIRRCPLCKIQREHTEILNFHSLRCILCPWVWFTKKSCLENGLFKNNFKRFIARRLKEIPKWNKKIAEM